MLEKYTRIILKNSNNKSRHTSGISSHLQGLVHELPFPDRWAWGFRVGLLDRSGGWLDTTWFTSKIPKSEMEFHLFEEIVDNVNTAKFNNTRNWKSHYTRHFVINSCLYLFLSLKVCKLNVHISEQPTLDFLSPRPCNYTRTFGNPLEWLSSWFHLNSLVVLLSISYVPSAFSEKEPTCWKTRESLLSQCFTWSSNRGYSFFP